MHYHFIYVRKKNALKGIQLQADLNDITLSNDPAKIEVVDQNHFHADLNYPDQTFDALSDQEKIISCSDVIKQHADRFILFTEDHYYACGFRDEELRRGNREDHDDYYAKRSKMEW